MYGPFQKARHVLRGGAALVLALLLCAAMPARAAGVTAGGADQDTSARMLVPVGHTVGIKLFARGVMVVKAPESGTPADDCGLQTGDIIVKCGGVSVTSSEQFQSLLQENGETATDLQVRREGGSVTLSVSPEQNEKGAYCIGAWIRDSMAGIGTMTYYDPESGAFGALGHGITDADTALLMPFASGSILPSTVKAVKKGAIGEAGEPQIWVICTPTPPAASSARWTPANSPSGWAIPCRLRPPGKSTPVLPPSSLMWRVMPFGNMMWKFYRL